jgi:hypothetical protein
MQLWILCCVDFLALDCERREGKDEHLDCTSTNDRRQSHSAIEISGFT